MDPQGQAVELVWKRLLEEIPSWVIFTPIAFALLIALLVALFRPERKLASFLWALVPIGIGTLVYLPFAYLLMPTLKWIVIMVPILGIAFFYVGMMYLRDARSIHPVWASFLGLLRTCVYVMLATVFLLPGCQYFEEVVTHPRVLFLFDVSGSMSKQDDIPELGQDVTKLPTRQEKVIQFLNAKKEGQDAAFLPTIVGRTDVTAYRFGPILDETDIRKFAKGTSFESGDFSAWLKVSKENIALPAGVDDKKKAELKIKREDHLDNLTSGTNLGGSALQMMKLENNSLLQSIIIFSDGQNNAGSDETMREFLDRVNQKGRSVPVITVGVGEDRQPANIRIEDILAPELAQPDDKFPLKIPVIGQGLVDEPFQVFLDLVRIKDNAGEPVAGEKAFTLGPKVGKFQGAGDNPVGTVEFEIDLQDLKQIKSADDSNGLLEGTWKIVARVPRHARESYPKAEHESEPVEVLVQKRKLRVLLMAGGPTREYQFVRSLLYRETIHKRIDLTVYLQTAKEDHVDQDVDKERLLNNFPDRLGAEDPAHKFMSLNEHDVVIAIDPDWSLLSPMQLSNLKEWVNSHGGGVVFVAGPVFTYQVARQGGVDLSALKTIFPVELEDSRLHGLMVAAAHKTTDPYPLKFAPAAGAFDFLRLDESAEDLTAGWNQFFWGAPVAPEGGKNLTPKRGFYNYYPVKALRPDSTVLATFQGPESSRINNGKDEQPFIVSMRYGTGKTMYLSAGEFWRLRQYKNGFHERFWIKLARNVSSGNTPQKKYGSIWLPRTAAAGTIPFEARVRGANMMPLPKDARPVTMVKKLNEEGAKSELVDLKAKPGDGEWTGIFTGSVKLRDPGEYEFRIPITGTNQYLMQKLTVRKQNAELDNTRINFEYLMNLASDANVLLPRLDATTRAFVERRLKASVSTEGGNDEKAMPKLFFKLNEAGLILDCIKELQPKRESVKGPFIDLWDKGFATGYTVNLYAMLCIALAVMGLFAGLIMYLQGSKTGGVAIAVFSLVLAPALGLAIYAMEWDWPVTDFNVSIVLVTAVTLLGVEWLTRKLLKLA